MLCFMGEAVVTGLSHHQVGLLHLPLVLLGQVGRVGHGLLLAMAEL